MSSAPTYSEPTNIPTITIAYLLISIHIVNYFRILQLKVNYIDNCAADVNNTNIIYDSASFNTILKLVLICLSRVNVIIIFTVLKISTG